MKKIALMTIILFAAFLTNLTAQPFLQLDPNGLYKENVNMTNADWAGFYYTSQYDKIGESIMLLLPSGDSIVGYCASKNAQYIRFIKGKIQGNGIKYTYEEIDLTSKKKDSETGSGFMVMKDDNKKENVYCKHGDSKGMKAAEGCYTAGKKKNIELIKGDLTSTINWANEWKMDAKYDNAVFNLEKIGAGYIGFYSLKNYKTSETKYGYYTNVTTTRTFPKSTVMVLGLPCGDQLYYISIHKDGDKVYAGVLTMAADQNSFTGLFVDNGEVKDLGEKGNEKISCKR
jgi:hypothetical protein